MSAATTKADDMIVMTRNVRNRFFFRNAARASFFREVVEGAGVTEIAWLLDRCM
jgi:hypothetical protein